MRSTAAIFGWLRFFRTISRFKTITVWCYHPSKSVKYRMCINTGWKMELIRALQCVQDIVNLLYVAGLNASQKLALNFRIEFSHANFIRRMEYKLI